MSYTKCNITGCRKEGYAYGVWGLPYSDWPNYEILCSECYIYIIKHLVKQVKHKR